jgi:hypothetical protein
MTVEQLTVVSPDADFTLALGFVSTWGLLGLSIPFILHRTKRIPIAVESNLFIGLHT